MYHVELRHFPHNMCRFNIGDQELWAIVEPWARGQPIEFGEYTWNPQQATLRILEGPEIPLGQLTMGRGWRTAERQGTDVTDKLIARARQALFSSSGAAPSTDAPATPASGVEVKPAPAAATAPAGGGPAAPGGAPGVPGVSAAPFSDPFALGMQMAALLGPDAMRLLDAWRAAAAGSPGLAPSEALARAEAAVRDSGGAHG